MHCCCCCCCTDALLWSQALDIEGFENMLVLLSEFIGVKRPHLHSSAIGDLVAMVLQQVSSTDGQQQQQQQQHLSSSSEGQQQQHRGAAAAATAAAAAPQQQQQQHLSSSSREKRQKRDSSIPTSLVFPYNITCLIAHDSTETAHGNFRQH